MSTAMKSGIKSAKSLPPAGMSDAELAAQKKRYRGVLLISAVCVFVAFGGIYGHITLHQVWGLPLFALAMVCGFGTQIAFIVGLVKASRDKGV
jgi:cyanate permease